MSSMWLADSARRRAWLTSLVEQATSEWELARIGAGPLEDFVSDDPDDHDQTMPLSIELAHARQWERFWVNGEWAHQLWAIRRVMREAGQPIALDKA